MWPIKESIWQRFKQFLSCTVMYCIGPSHVLLLCGFVFLKHSLPHFLYFKCKCVIVHVTQGILESCIIILLLKPVRYFITFCITCSLATGYWSWHKFLSYFCCMLYYNFVLEKKDGDSNKCKLTPSLGKCWLFFRLGVKAYPECFAAAVDLPIVVSESLMFSTSDIIG